MCVVCLMLFCNKFMGYFFPPKTKLAVLPGFQEICIEIYLPKKFLIIFFYWLWTKSFVDSTGQVPKFSAFYWSITSS